MGLSITTNVSTITAERKLNAANIRFAKNSQKMASGMRINHASDDAAGLAISESLRANIKSLGAAKRNNLDGISIVQVAEGGLHAIGDMLIRMRELGIQAASDTVSDPQRNMIQYEIQQLQTEIDRIAKGAKWSGNKLLSGDGDSYDFQVGIHNDSFADRISFSPSDNNATADALKVSGMNYSTKHGAQDSLKTLDAAITKVSTMKSNLGAMQKRLEHSMFNVEVSKENVTKTESQIRDTDMAFRTSEMAKEQVLMQASAITHAQAKSTPQSALKLLG